MDRVKGILPQDYGPVLEGYLACSNAALDQSKELCWKSKAGGETPVPSERFCVGLLMIAVSLFTTTGAKDKRTKTTLTIDMCSTAKSDGLTTLNPGR